MKLEKLYITGFGALRNVEFPELGAGLNVIEGANEAGKTTLLEFVRTLFFGFVPRDKNTQDARRYEPRDGGAHGGWAIVQNRHGERLRIERAADKSSAGKCDVQLIGQDGQRDIDGLLGSTDRVLYEQVFAFSLDELNDLSASANQLGNRVYAASSGGVVLQKAIDVTNNTARDIYLKGGIKPELSRAISEYKKLQESIKGAGDHIEAYNNDRAESEKWQQIATSLREQFKNAEAQLNTAKQHHEVWETWVELMRLREDLHALPASSAIADGHIGKMKELQNEHHRYQEKLEESQVDLQYIDRELENNVPEEAILQNAPEINRLKDSLISYESTLRMMPELQRKWEKCNQQITEQLAELGADWNETKLATMDTSRKPRSRMNHYEKTLDAMRQNWEAAIQSGQAIAERIADQQKSLQRMQEEMRREFSTEPPSTIEIKTRTNALRDIENLLGYKMELTAQRDLAAESLRIRQKYADLNVQNSSESTLTPKVLFPTWASAIPFILGLGGLVTFILLRGEAAFGVIIFVILCAVSAGMLWISRLITAAPAPKFDPAQQNQRKRDAEEITDLEKNIRSVEEKITQVDNELRQMTTQFGWHIENREDLRRAEDILQGHREARGRFDNSQRNIHHCDDEMAQITASQQLVQEKIAQAKSTFEQNQREWENWLIEQRLPSSLSPRDALWWLDSIQKIRVDLGIRDDAANALRDAQKELDQFVEDAAKLWQILHREVPSHTDIPAGVRMLHSELDEQKEKVAKRDAMIKQQQKSRNNYDYAATQLANIAENIAAILRETATENIEDFETKTRLLVQRQEIESKCREQEKILDTHSAPGPKRLKLERELTELDKVQMEENLHRAQVEYDCLQQKLSHADEQRGAWGAKVRQLEESEGELSHLLRRQEELKTLIADLTAHWALARTTNILLEETQKRFEKERQPAVIKRAGLFMQNVTDGRYQAVLTSGMGMIELDEGERGRKPLSYWSRGTKEQFYLALRLAFIEDYCSKPHLEPLPVIMDDVLVHSDGYQRLMAAGTMIQEFAENHQVLYFTCRPEDGDKLCQAAPLAKRFQLQKDGGIKVLL